MATQISSNRVILNVSGTRYEVTQKCLMEHISTRLGKLALYQKQDNPEEFYFERPTVPFESILTYYQTGQLHLPPNVCPKVFKEELRFWEIDDEVMEQCCRLNYIQFMDSCENKAAFRSLVDSRLKYIDSRPGSFRERVWRIIDYKETTWIAKLVLFVGIFFVILSVATVAISSLPHNKRPLTPCEWSEYIDSTDSTNNEMKEYFSKYDCESIRFSNLDGEHTFQYWQEPEENPPNQDKNQLDREGQQLWEDKKMGFIEARNLTSSNVSIEDDETVLKMSLPSLTMKNYLFYKLDYITTAFFTVELIVRLMACPSWRSYFSNVLNIIEVFVLLGAFVEIIIHSMKNQFKFSSTVTYIIDSLKLFRVLRLLRYCQHLAAVQVLRYSLRQNVKDLLVLLIHICIVLLIFANIVYIAEDRSTIDSIPQGWWLGLVTITTVGYGDISPLTLPGKLACSVCALCGIIMLSLIIPIFVDTFVQLYGIAHVQSYKPSRKDEQPHITEVKKIDLSKENEVYTS